MARQESSKADEYSPNPCEKWKRLGATLAEAEAGGGTVTNRVSGGTKATWPTGSYYRLYAQYGLKIMQPEGCTGEAGGPEFPNFRKTVLISRAVNAHFMGTRLTHHKLECAQS